jgi:dienelactone hydrolase
MSRLYVCFALACSLSIAAADDKKIETLPGTDRLTMEGDIAAQLVEGVDRFLLRKIDESVAKRERHWKRDFSSREAYEKSIEPNRKRLAKILGIRDERIKITPPDGDVNKLDFNSRRLWETIKARDERVKFDGPELIDTPTQPALLAENEKMKVYAVRWPVLRDMWSEGLLLVPKGEILANVVAIPNADQTPEQFAGLVAPADDDPNQRFPKFPNSFVASGCRVLVPTLINRSFESRYGRATLTNREFLYRSAFELGQHLIGYEVQKVLAGVDWLSRNADGKNLKTGVAGVGDGGMIALYSAALDVRIEGAYIVDYFGSRERIWEQPIDRNVFGLLDEFGDAELATMIAPRSLAVEGFAPPLERDFPGKGGAPFKLSFPTPGELAAEVKRAEGLISRLEHNPIVTRSEKGDSPALKFVSSLGGDGRNRPSTSDTPKLSKFDPEARHQRLMHQIDAHNQWLLSESPYIRKEFMKNLDTSSVEAYEKTVEPYREIFAKEVVGQFDDPLLEPKPRTRKTYDNEKWTGYEVVLDVWPDVIAYGILCVPKDLDIKGNEKRPVVVCQHGLEGRPQDVIGEQGSQYYSAFAGKLAEQGFITFAPQNLYIGHDKFRTLQRKANPLGKTLFSVIVPQHQQIVNWLSSLPYVDKDRIAFYGLSYGGKSAMRIPPLVKNYCLSICSADFNEWVDKNASTRGPYSYVWTGEYEIFEFDLGSTFNYAEMAALICPRPFMVERGHFDGVGEDERVGFEYAKVQHLYAANLKIPDRCAIEWFDGPHKINGVGTYAFLRQKLNWEKK